MDTPDLWSAFVPRHARLEVDESDESVSVLVDTSGDQQRGRDSFPFLVERRRARGKVLLVATTADEEWSDLLAYPLYPILGSECVRYLSASTRSGANVVVGEPLSARYPAALAGRPAQLLAPLPGRASELEPTDAVRLELGRGDEEGSSEARLRHPDTGVPGFYVLREEGVEGDASNLDSFAVNLEPTEGDLTRINPTELEQAVGDVSLEVASDSADVESATEASSEFPGWRIFLWILLVVLVAETILAQRFGDFGNRSGRAA
jgi:hypothetical protein